jgi:predicted ATPase/DNA-binding CsgD family transcriptional regulator/DNA-binding XRE family transcriptional regulator
VARPAPYAFLVGADPQDSHAASPAARIHRLRAGLGLSQEQLARQLGVSFATVNRWESGRTQMSARASRALAEFEARTGADRSPAGLPSAQSSFIGRERELAELAGLLGTARLVSLVGPGGAGKTRLAVEAIRRWDPAASVVFVPLEPVRQPGSLLPAVASCVGARDRPGETAEESVAAALAAAPRLVVLDGAEHLRAAVAELAGTLLGAVDGLRIVVTSRVVLGVPGEVCWAVPPLECPSAAAGVSDIAASDAVRLFLARAQARMPGFTGVAPHAIAELCRRLDGLPLAIELIAGWVGTLSVREILAERAVLLDQELVGDGQTRGRRLTDVVRRSYDLLETGQQRLLPELSVFAGKFTVADARAITGEPTALAPAIRGLVDSSWLAVTQGAEHNTFGMLETMRSFAAALLDAGGAGPKVRRRHAAHFAGLARDSEEGIAGPDAAGWTSRLGAAAADLDVALHWADASGDTDLGLDMSAALWRWWLVSGRLAAGRAWLATFLAGAGNRRDELAGRALCSAAVLAAENGDYAAAIRQGQRALQAFEPLGERERMAFAATVVGSAHRYLGDRAAARRSFQSAMDLREAVGDRRGVSVAMNNMALLALDEGDLAGARGLLEQALVVKRQLGEQRSLAIGLTNLADILIRTGQWDAARRALDEGTELAAGLGNPQLIGTLCCNQGHVAAGQHRWAEAAGQFQAAVGAHREAGHPYDTVEPMIGLGRACHQLGQAADAVRHLRDAEAVASELGAPQRLAEVRAALAEIGETAAAALPDGLTARQAEVLTLLATGLSNKEIAGQLYLSPATVERHLATVYRKLGVSGRVEAARYAMAHGLASPSR